MQQIHDRWAVMFGGDIRPLHPTDVQQLGVGPERVHLRVHEGAPQLCRARGLWAPVNETMIALVGRHKAALLGPSTPERWGVTGITWHGILASHPAMLHTLERLALAAQSDAPVWLWGESGTGKERAAAALHRASARAGGPYVALNCAALPETLAEAELFGVRRGAFTGADRDRKGAFERAHGGTLLLDEVGELSPTMQAKLLRVLEEKEVTPLGAPRPIPVDVRVVVASWVDLERRAIEGGFRPDLLHRLWALRIQLPPLRDRPTDTVLLARLFLSELDALELLDADVVRARLVSHPWPGNVRGLRNACIRAAVWGEVTHLLEPHHAGHRAATAGAKRRRYAGQRLDRGALTDLIGSNVTTRAEAARRLGISRSTLYRWLSEPAVTPEPPSPNRRPTAHG